MGERIGQVFLLCRFAFNILLSWLQSGHSAGHHWPGHSYYGSKVWQPTSNKIANLIQRNAITP
jgi:hypothetical protein